MTTQQQTVLQGQYDRECSEQETRRQGQGVGKRVAEWWQKGANLALLAGAREAGGAQGTPGAQQPQPDCPTGKTQQAEDQHAPVHIAFVILQESSCTQYLITLSWTDSQGLRQIPEIALLAWARHHAEK